MDARRQRSTRLAAALLALCVAAGEVLSAQTPAERRVAAAERRIEANAAAADAHSDLAVALAQRARETADPAYYDQADAAAGRALALVPGHAAATRVRVWTLLGRHEFAAARDAAEALRRDTPDDPQVHAFLVDAYAELGDYAAAEAAAQRLLDLRPGSVAALTRAAYLRELFGDPEGALELMATAFDRVPPAEVEDRAWILTQVAHLQRTTGRLEAADAALAEALALVADYHYALGQLARVRLAQGDTGTAIALLERRYRAAPHPENLYDLARALHAGGRIRDARVAFGAFERKARSERDRADNANHELAFYYVDYGRRPTAAAAVAAAELKRRRDVRTLEACGWALAATGQLRAARACVEDAIAVGIRDAELYYRAGNIARRQGDIRAARTLLRESLAINPRAESAPSARRELQALERHAR